MGRKGTGKEKEEVKKDTNVWHVRERRNEEK